MRNYSIIKFLKIFSRNSFRWKSVVGLEIHAQIATESKLFSGSRNRFSDPINSSVALLDASIPGSLPVLNRRCVEAGIKTALALSCQVNEISMFDRKHYFYADLPVGYQITQQRAPLASHGSLSFPVVVPDSSRKPYYKTVRLHQLQLEQDSGKSLHDEDAGISMIDLNRAGVPLMELVFDPDLEDGEEAAALVKELVLILTSLETCSCKMEEGAFRVDANISIHQENEPLGVRTEVKNIGSVRGVAQAVAYEIQRQITVKNQGGVIVNETRSWNAPTKSTIPMRDKEVVQDYRFMPEPNLPPLHLNLSQQDSDELINVRRIQEELPELPQAFREKLVAEQNLTQELAIILVNQQALFSYFKEITEANKNRSAKSVANFLMNDLLTICNKNNIEVDACKISAGHLGEVVDMLESSELNFNLSRMILQEMLESSKSPREISNEKNLKQISDEVEIERICQEVLKSAEGQKMLKSYKAGKTKVLGAITAKIYKFENRINMAKVNEYLKKL